MDQVDLKIRQTFEQANLDYVAKFGFVFLICATGKSATEMLQALKARIGNSMDQEITIACKEQEKIMILRINKMFLER